MKARHGGSHPLSQHPGKPRQEFKTDLGYIARLFLNLFPFKDRKNTTQQSEHAQMRRAEYLQGILWQLSIPPHPNGILLIPHKCFTKDRHLDEP